MEWVGFALAIIVLLWLTGIAVQEAGEEHFGWKRRDDEPS